MCRRIFQRRLNRDLKEKFVTTGGRTFPMISSQLKMENLNCFGKTIGDYPYHVKRNQGGSYIVFRNLPRNYSDVPQRRPVGRGYTEIQALPLGKAKKLLASGSNQFEPVGTDQRFYRCKKHLGLDVNVKNARVRARAEVSWYAIPYAVCGDGNCIWSLTGDRVRGVQTRRVVT